MKTSFSSSSRIAIRSLLISSVCFLLAAATETARAQVVSLSPTSLAFGSVVINTTSAGKKVTLRNTSASTVSVSIGLSGKFAQTNTCGGSLTAGATCAITVTFNPTATGSQTGAVTVSDSADSGSRTITLTGSGVLPVAVSPALQAFGSVAVGTTSAAKVFTVKNNQTTTTTVTISTSAPFAETGTCGSSLGAGASCTINATFTPTGTGLQKGSITIAYVGTGSPLSASVQGTGILPITISPTSRAFGSVALGTTSAAKVFTVKNNQTTGTTVKISTSAPFGETDTCASGLAAGGSCTINATFAPTVTGLQTGSITIAYAGMGSPQSVSVQGTGILPITISPTSRTFGSVTLGATSLPLAFTVKNNQTAPASLTISTGAPFAQTNNCATSLGAGASCTINATFAPTVMGLQTGSITIAYLGVGSPQTVGLQGTGVTPVTVSPTAVVFANQRVGTASSPRTVSITNRQTAPMTINSIATSGVFGQTNTCGSSLAAAASCSVAVVFNPTVVGPASGTLTITDSATTSPQVVALSGTGTVTNIVSIVITAPNPSVASGSKEQLKATATYGNGTTADITTSALWTSANPSIAIVGNTTGMATGMTAGSAKITAAVTGITVVGSLSLTVTGPTLQTIAVTPGNPSLAKGTNLALKATGTYSDGSTQDLTTQVGWSSSAGAVTVSSAAGSQGVVTGASVGSATVSAASTTPSVTGSTSVTVTPAIVQSITVSPASVSLGLNATQQYTAAGTYSDNTVSDITSLVSWTSGNPTVVSISAGGLATVLATSSSAIPISASLTNGAGTLITSPPAWLSALSSLPISCPAPTIDMKLLVINNAAANGGDGYADFPAIQQILNYVGTPYDVADVSGTLPALSDGQCHGYYQGVIYAFGDDIYTNTTFNSALKSYEQTFHVRQLNWYTNPTPDFGFNNYQGSITSSETDSGTFTAAAAPVFFYANLATPVSFSNAFIYLTTPTTPSEGGTVTPLLVDPSGYTLSGITNFSDGRQYLSQMFDSNPYLMHDLVLAYGLVNWVTKGVFLGDYHVYATQSVDDLFIDDSEWIPSTTCLANPLTEDRTPPDASNLPVFRINSADMTQLAAWQSAKQADPLLSQFKLTLAFNGVGTAGNGDWTGLTAPITFTSAVNGVGTISATDFAALPNQQVTVSGTTNGGGAFNGTFTILSVTSSAATTPGTTTFTVNLGNSASVTQQAEAHATASVPDDLVTNLQSYQQYFHWISHTYDHPNTLNGLPKSAYYPPNESIDLEVLTNLWVASGAGGVNLDYDSSDVRGLKQLTFTDFNPANMVTPGVTGLNDTTGVPGYLNEDGIQYVVTDTSVIGQTNNGPNPSPNVGIVNSYAPGVYEVPRHPNDIFYNVANWADNQAEFVCIYSYYVPPNSPVGTPPAPYPPFNTFSAAQILDFVSSSFVTNMLMGDMDPQMFHQPDLHFSDNYASLSAAPVPTGVTGITSPHVSSLITDTYDQTFSKYKALYNLPVLTPTLDQLGVLMKNRNSFNVSGVTASIVGAGTSTATITVTVPSSATSAVIPITGLNSAGAESYGGQHISHITITPGQTITFPLQ